MIQDYIVYFIILSAVLYTMYQIFIIFTRKKQSSCGDCPSCELKKEALRKKAT